MISIKKLFQSKIRKLILSCLPEAYALIRGHLNILGSDYMMGVDIEWDALANKCIGSTIGSFVKLNPPYKIAETEIGDYSYLAKNSYVSKTKIGKFCSIGPNFLCGYGIHPTNGISTAPMFYSNLKQNGVSFSKCNKIEERRTIEIGNDVFIGANVTVIDGVKIGDGAVIGAGAVVSKDIPPYAIAVGCPIKVVRFRFDPSIIDRLNRIQWWNWRKEDLCKVEEMFFDVDTFVEMYDRQ